MYVSVCVAPKATPSRTRKVAAHHFGIFNFSLSLLLYFSQISDRQKSFIQILFDCFAIFAVVVEQVAQKDLLGGSRKLYDREAETGDAHLFVWEISSGGHRKYYFDDNNLGLLFNLNTQTFGKVEKCWTITRKEKEERGKRRDSSDGSKNKFSISREGQQRDVANARLASHLQS